MLAMMVAKAWVFCTYSLSCGRITPLKLGTPPWVAGLGFVMRVVASGLLGSVRLSPTVAKLNTTGSDCASARLPVVNALILAASSAHARRRASRLEAFIILAIPICSKSADSYLEHSSAPAVRHGRLGIQGLTRVTAIRRS